ncbi:MAG: hypothetical protein V4726_03865 [Verrucomicrobiota bacterium]
MAATTSRMGWRETEMILVKAGKLTTEHSAANRAGNEASEREFSFVRPFPAICRLQGRRVSNPDKLRRGAKTTPPESSGPPHRQHIPPRLPTIGPP